MATQEIMNDDQKVIITLDGNRGKIIIKDKAGNEILRLGEEKTVVSTGHGHPPQEISLGSNMVLMDAAGQVRFRVRASGRMDLGGKGSPGELLLFKADEDSQATLIRPSICLDAANGSIELKSTDGENSIHLDAGLADIHLGGHGHNGNIMIYPTPGDNKTLDQTTIHLAGNTASLRMGRNQTNGSIALQSTDGGNRIYLDAKTADIHLGGNGQNGDLIIHHQYGDNQQTDNTTIQLMGETGVVRTGGNLAYGAVIVRGGDNKDRIRLISQDSSIHLGGNGAYGSLFLYASGDDNHTPAQATLHLDGKEGDIILSNADCAEDFDVPEGEEIEPGTVVVINSEGQLQQSTQAYDRKVAGVISGAGDCRPGIVLGRQQARDARLPVALTGRVYCKVDTHYSPVEVGDLLTTSPTPGYAMKAQDPLRAFGAVIGKALRRFDEGRGLIPILVALQ